MYYLDDQLAEAYQAIKDVGYNGEIPSNKEFLEAVQLGIKSPTYVRLFCSLTIQLYLTKEGDLSPNVQVPDNAVDLLGQSKSFLKELGSVEVCYYKLFLITQLCTEIIMASKVIQKSIKKSKVTKTDIVDRNDQEHFSACVNKDCFNVTKGSKNNTTKDVQKNVICSNLGEFEEEAYDNTASFNKGKENVNVSESSKDNNRRRFYGHRGGVSYSYWKQNLQEYVGIQRRVFKRGRKGSNSKSE